MHNANHFLFFEIVKTEEFSCYTAPSDISVVLQFTSLDTLFTGHVEFGRTPAEPPHIAPESAELHTRKPVTSKLSTLQHHASTQPLNPEHATSRLPARHKSSAISSG
jgi:hypothetical protein